MTLNSGLDVSPMVQSSSVLLPSGESGLLVGEVDIVLKTLLISWQNITTPGELHVGDFVILQGEGSDLLVLPCHDIETHGLRTSNNSYGGRYSVIAFYNEVVA